MLARMSYVTRINTVKLKGRVQKENLLLIKNVRKTAPYQDKLNSLVRLFAERNKTNELDFSVLIQKFNDTKTRNKTFT